MKIKIMAARIAPEDQRSGRSEGGAGDKKATQLGRKSQVRISILFCSPAVLVRRSPVGSRSVQDGVNVERSGRAFGEADAVVTDA